MNQVEKLRTLIRESINEYIREVEDQGNIAAQEAKVSACDQAIALREKKINMEGLDESFHDMISEEKLKELKNEIKALENYKKKATRSLEKMKAKKNKGSEKKEEEEVVTDSMTEDAPIDEMDIANEMNIEEAKKKDKKEEDKKDKKDKKDKEEINESFLKMQKLAGVITEGQYRKLIENEDYTPPAYEAINDLMDYINMNTGTKGRIVPYRSISWLPKVSPADENMDMLVYTHPTNTFITKEGKKEKQEIAIGADDVYQDPYDENFNAWVIDSNDPSLDFGEYLTFDEAENAASEWLKS